MLVGVDARPVRGTKKRQALAAQTQVQTGVIQMWPTATPPDGSLMCNGQAVSRRDYGALFAIMGTTFGVGDGATTFNLPNYNDRMPIGAGNLYAVAATGGSKDAVVVAHTHTTSGTTSSDGSHTHNVNYKNSGGSAAGSGLLRGVDTDGADSTFVASGGAHTHTTTGTAASTGVSGTGANLPPYLGVYFIIKT
jgi:microcystin-dependent protein